MNHQHEIISSLYAAYAGKPPLSLHPLPASGSSRQYFRLAGAGQTVIGAINSDHRENEAFVRFTEHFRKLNLPVPEIFAYDAAKGAWLLEDLGDTTLFNWLNDHRPETENAVCAGVYKRTLDDLLRFQMEGIRGMDESWCYPHKAFDERSVLWDLNYFKYYFLKLAGAGFDEGKLEDDFRNFSKLLMQAAGNTFLYRDFQSRNIMLHKNSLYYLDYQGGRKGAPQYDVASLLYDAKAALPQSFRDMLLEHYCESYSKITGYSVKDFLQYFYSFALIRVLQAMGAYGFRGYYEKKSHFLLSIPYALRNLEFLLYREALPASFRELRNVLESLLATQHLREYGALQSDKLTVTVSSFSYKKGIPDDKSGNGGGFVFDCRALPNPGREERYARMDGRDADVIAYLEEKKETSDFFQHTYALCTSAVENYISRGFRHLMISFGCTGGQHRSVYFAGRMAGMLKTNHDVHVILNHRELKQTQTEKK